MVSPDLESSSPQENFPMSQSPEFQHGFSEYSLIKRGRFYDNSTGSPLFQGLIVNQGQNRLLLSGFHNTLEYTQKARALLKDYERAGDKITNAIVKTAQQKLVLYPLTQNDVFNLKVQLIGFGQAALKDSDVQTSLWACDSAGILHYPSVQETIARFISNHPDLRDTYNQTMAEIKEAKIMELRSRPQRKSPIGSPVEVRSFDKTGFTYIEGHGGGGEIWIGKRTVLKFPKESKNQFDREVMLLQKLRGEGGIPLLIAYIDQASHYGGIEIERVIGTPLNKLSIQKDFVLEKFGLSQRLWLIYDLLEFYAASGQIHGDLFNYDGFLRQEALSVNKPNFILEDDTGRLRLLDPYAGEEHSLTSLINPKVELQGMVEFLFMGRDPSALPTSDPTKQIGQQILEKVKAITKISDLSKIIPEIARLPNDRLPSAFKKI